jgi:O-antigen/teichoic acid export membrane protein
MSTASPAHHAGTLVLGRVLATISEALIPVFIVRLLGKVEVGQLTEVLLVYTTLEMVVTGGLPATLSYYIPTRAPPERRAIARRIAAILLLLGLASSFLLLAMSWVGWSGRFQGQESLVYFAALAPFPLGDVPLRMLPNLLVAEEHSQGAAMAGILRSMAVTLATLVPLGLGQSLWIVMLSLSGCGALFGALTLYWLHKLYRGVPRVPCDVPVMQILRFGFPLGLTELVANLNNRFDRFLIAIFYSQAAYAVYQAGSWQFPLIPSISYAVGVAYGPVLVRLFEERRAHEAVHVWREQAKKTALLVVPIAAIFVLAAEETIEVLFTSDYRDGAFVFRCYSAMTLGRITAFGTILVSAGKPGYVIRSATAAFLSNIVITVPLLLLIGFNGPALGTLLAFIPMVAAYCWHIGRATGAPFTQTFPLVGLLKVLGVTAAASVPALLFKLLVPLPALWKLCIEGALLLSCFGVLGSLLGLIEAEDWRFVRDWLWLKGLRRPRPLAPSA